MEPCVCCGHEAEDHDSLGLCGQCPCICYLTQSELDEADIGTGEYDPETEE